MNKLESIVIAVLLGIACPWLTFVAMWWTAAIVSMKWHLLSEPMIAGVALFGLAVGVVLDLVFLRTWVRRFYSAGIGWLAGVYVALSVVAVASFMGLPVGTFVLGIVAGTYAGRRQHHHAAVPADANRRIRRAALFAALITAGAALPIGLLALRERSVLQLLASLLRVEEVTVGGAMGIFLIVVLSVLLFVAQYWCAKQGGRVAFLIDGGAPLDQQTRRKA
jgi:hypothetical protein